MCRPNWFYYDLRVCTELQVLSKTVSLLWFYAYKKYKNGNSARRTSTQRHIWLSICHGRSDNFRSGLSRKLPKIANSNVIFSRTADLIAAKFCKTIKIKPNNIFQNSVHSTSPLSLNVCITTSITFQCKSSRIKKLIKWHEIDLLLVYEHDKIECSIMQRLQHFQSNDIM